MDDTLLSIEANDSPFKMNSKLSEFKILSRLGKGSFSVVEKVLRIQDGKIYALKKVSMDKLTQKEKENALNEVRILSAIQNEYVVKYKDSFFDSDSNSLCIVMEYVGEEDLSIKIAAQREKNKKSMRVQLIEEEKIWQYLIQCLLGLNSLHEMKVIHRDIKSANIFIDERDCPKIGDLNVSKIIKGSQLMTLSIQTGTPYYTAPEIWRQGLYSDKSDIYSLGCVIYELCTLMPPFNGKSLEGLMHNILNGFYSQISDNYSQELAQIISLCLHVDPNFRPNCKQMLSISSIKERIQKREFYEIKENLLITPQKKQIKSKRPCDLLEAVHLPLNVSTFSEYLPASNYESKVFLQDSKNSILLNDQNIVTPKKEEFYPIKEKKINNFFYHKINHFNNFDKLNQDETSNQTANLTLEKQCASYSSPGKNKRKFIICSAENSIPTHKFNPSISAQETSINKSYQSHRIPFSQLNINQKQRLLTPNQLKYSNDKNKVPQTSLSPFAQNKQQQTNEKENIDLIEGKEEISQINRQNCKLRSFFGLINRSSQSSPKPQLKGILSKQKSRDENLTTEVYDGITLTPSPRSSNRKPSKHQIKQIDNENEFQTKGIKVSPINQKKQSFEDPQNKQEQVSKVFPFSKLLKRYLTSNQLKENKIQQIGAGNQAYFKSVNNSPRGPCVSINKEQLKSKLKSARYSPYLQSLSISPKKGTVRLNSCKKVFKDSILNHSFNVKFDNLNISFKENEVNSDNLLKLDHIKEPSLNQNPLPLNIFTFSKDRKRNEINFHQHQPSVKAIRCDSKIINSKNELTKIICFTPKLENETVQIQHSPPKKIKAAIQSSQMTSNIVSSGSSNYIIKSKNNILVKNKSNSQLQNCKSICHFQNNNDSSKLLTSNSVQKIIYPHFRSTEVIPSKR